jgi:hypothetical protein
VSGADLRLKAEEIAEITRLKAEEIAEITRL